MISAVLAGVLVALVLIVIAALGLAARARKQSEKAPHRSDVTELSHMSVGSMAENSDLEVKQGPSATTKLPSDGLKSRFAALGILGLGIFGALSAKVFTLQVASGSDYAAKAEKNLYTSVSTPAPRGYIYDVKGNVLAGNKSLQTVLADPEVADDPVVLRRLSGVLGIPVNVVRQRIQDASSGAQSQRVVATGARLRDVAFISEHSVAFPGISAETRTTREYPFGALAAHVLGYTSSVTEEDASTQREGREIKSNDVIGKSGIEYFYDDLIAGDHGQRRVMKDAGGSVLDVVSETKPTKGCDITLTLDARVQYVADTVLADLIAPNDGTIGSGRGVAGAAVVMDVRDGSIVAMSSYPTFEPSHFTGAVPTDIWKTYNEEKDEEDDYSYAALNNRAINGLYAAASTYKAFTSLAGLQYGFASGDNSWECTGSWDGFNTGSPQMCWKHEGHGYLGLREGIVKSCDVVFYEIGKSFYTHGPEGTGELSATALQEFLEKFRLNQPTGIDLGGESSGRIPTPQWKQEMFANRPADAVWRGGDYTNMIIGQGDVLVTPLEIAVAYGALATGNFMKPHLLKEVMNADGEVVVTFEPEVVQTLDVNESHLALVRDALRGVVTENESAKNVFEEQGLRAAGKSGTAEHTNREDDAWFVAYAPYDDPKYVAACVIERGGGGTAGAAPVVARLLREALDAAEDKSSVAVAAIPGWNGRHIHYAGEDEGRTD